MSHFFRLKTINDTEGKADIGAIDFYYPSGKSRSFPIELIRRNMEEVSLDPPWPECRMLRAPLTSEGYEQEVLVFKRKKDIELPDIWAWGFRLLVSEKAKSVLEACDNFGHEYIETEVQDENHQRINQTPYYLLNVRRILEIDQLGGVIENEYSMFSPSYIEELILPVIQQNLELKAKVSQLPMWRHYADLPTVYLSEVTLNKLLEAEVTGLKPYSGYYGKFGESIGRFE